ncbi:class I SAM-dependent methyltransferase [Streptomyces sp. A73]|uniref:class I SAM-dependent methyltransferase n=1 Tax=Streptomyces sp. B15 TaxID=1537797 RepID=UPI001B38C7FC|nr:class I SAM-dependent methyltransferase [Streptomyces sp. B15]MBQ1119584.1 class I SAM-dependent methyltransferase [Streptomyces sp. B15]MBQ1161173.1 class I SAM-dependent methyltransferase [Streptomyces sp. A73]
MTTHALNEADWKRWQESWDRQQEWYLPDREERFRVMLDMTEALVGPEPRVLDLACGTGSISDRVLRRMPNATTVGVDRDPALLSIARGTFAGDRRATFVTADLSDPDWPTLLPEGPYDAVLTATALHWMHTEPLRALYGRLAGVVREGGVFMNADHMPDESTPRINAAVHIYEEEQRKRRLAEGALDWSGWWRALSEDPALAAVAQERFALFGNPAEVRHDHNNEEFQTAAWHASTLREVGFAESRTVWASPTDAIVLGLR